MLQPLLKLFTWTFEISNAKKVIKQGMKLARIMKLGSVVDQAQVCMKNRAFKLI